MKNWFKYITTLFAGVALLATSCEDPDVVIDEVTAETERGAVLRTVNLISNELPIGDESGNFSVELEIQDSENGGLVNEVEVYVGFRDNSEDVGPGTDVDESIFATVSSSEFTNGPFGLPRFTYSIPLSEMLAFVGRTDAEITGGDQFTVRFELVLSDGRRYSFDDNTGTLTGSFFSSPFLYTPTVICPVDSEAFTGTYALTQETDGIFGVTFQEENVEVTAGGSTSRTIAVTGYPQFGGFPLNFQFELICGEVVVSTLDTGLTCVSGEPTIIYQAADVTTTYDDTDDSTLTIIFAEVGNSCGGNADVTITLTKV